VVTRGALAAVRRFPPAQLLLLAALWVAATAAGCASDASRARALPAIQTLDEAGSARFRQAFDEATDRPRYIVALSPT